VRLFKMSVDHNIDIHMAISSAMDYARYEKILSPVADRLKNPLREYIPLKHDKERSITPFLHSSGKVEEIIFSAHEDELKKEQKKLLKNFYITSLRK
jgi:hypothetical protein